jgi:hypothetical protein
MVDIVIFELVTLVIVITLFAEAFPTKVFPNFSELGEAERSAANTLPVKIEQTKQHVIAKDKMCNLGNYIEHSPETVMKDKQLLAETSGDFVGYVLCDPYWCRDPER